MPPTGSTATPSPRPGATGLLKGRGLDRWVACAGGCPLAVVVADIEHFTRANGTVVHEAGDRVLVAVADRLAAEVRADDALERLGGKEFCVVMVATPEAALDAAGRMRRAIASHPAETAAGPVSVRASFGVAHRWRGPTPAR